MQFLVHLKLGGSRPNSETEGRAFIERSIFPTLDRCMKLVDEGKIIAGGPVSGAVALVLIVEAASAKDLDDLIASLPVWTRMETTVTPLTTFSDRRESVRVLLETLEGRERADQLT